MDAGSARGGFGTSLGFVLAAAGSAVGLGNLWKFPYVTGVHGGGAFVLVYLGCVALVGLPLMYGELVVGKRGGGGLAGALRKLVRRRSRAARAVAATAGALAVLTSALVLAGYAVVAGWSFHLLFHSLGLASRDLGPGEVFSSVSTSPWRSSAWLTVFLALAAFVVRQGVQSGIERACRVLMPGLVVLLLALVVYVAVTAGLGDALAFLFAPKWTELSSEAVLEALGHAFFTLSLGMGAMVVYGSYAESEATLVRDGVAIVILDTAIALVAGTVIFATVLDAGGEPSAGPGLLFQTMPALFADMPGGGAVAVAFFVMVVFAAWSSAIAMLEVAVAWLVEERGWPRERASTVAALACWLGGLACAWSPPLFAAVTAVPSQVLLPLGGLLVALAVGWLVGREDREAGFLALGERAAVFARGWTLVVRWVTPALVVLVLLYSVGVVG